MDFLITALSAPLLLVGLGVGLALSVVLLPLMLNLLLGVIGYTGGKFAYPASMDELVASLSNFYVLSVTVVAVGMVLGYFGHAFHG